ncbi:Lrp/AsnC ligand binding domain-containing protein [Candidatus Methylomirabilis sp.]|uniref:Lrp/AsnC ligand binding domain-containing protein n=1 Tax=Candidatus Methylomirabilis sp. TaxID=2032687 RepID=UPI003C75657A
MNRDSLHHERELAVKAYLMGGESMVHAYVFITTSKAREQEVADAIGELQLVKLAHIVTGNIDVVAFIEAPDLSALWDTVNHVQALPAVTRTTTSLVVEPV